MSASLKVFVVQRDPLEGAFLMLMKREILHMIFAMLIVSLSALSSTPSQVNGTHEQDDIVIDSRNPAVMFQYFTEKERVCSLHDFSIF